MHRGQERKQGGRHSWFEGKRGVRSWDAGYVCSGWGREGGQPLCGSDGRRPHPEERVHCWGHRTDGGSEAVQRRALDARQLDFLTGLYFLPWRSSHWGDSQMSYPAPSPVCQPHIFNSPRGFLQAAVPGELQGHQVPESFLASRTPDPLPKAFKSLCTEALKPPDS